MFNIKITIPQKKKLINVLVDDDIHLYLLKEINYTYKNILYFERHFKISTLHTMSESIEVDIHFDKVEERNKIIYMIKKSLLEGKNIFEINEYINAIKKYEIL